VNQDLRYAPRVRELFAALPSGGVLSADPGALAVGEAVALDRGAWVRFEAHVATGRIRDCVFRAWGCPHTLAAAAWAALELRGLALDEAEAIDAARLARELAVPPEKMGRLLVVEDAIRSLFERARAVK
jgi:NifU-like protein involved in Fe-S cluster formation